MSALPPSPSRSERFAVFAALVYPALLTLVYFVLLDEATPAVQQASYAVGKLVQFGFPLLWVLGVQRRRVRPVGPDARGVAAGLAFGTLVAALMAGLYVLWWRPAGLFAGTAEAIREKVAGFGIGGPREYFALAAFYSLLHSFLEEYYWRWFVFGEMRRFVPPAAAVVLSSVGFAAHHVLVLWMYFGVSAPLLIFSLAVGLGGAFWAWLYHASGTLYGPWWSHLLVDAAIFAIGYDLIGDAWR